MKCEVVNEILAKTLQVLLNEDEGIIIHCDSNDQTYVVHKTVDYNTNEDIISIQEDLENGKEQDGSRVIMHHTKLQ